MAPGRQCRLGPVAFSILALCGRGFVAFVGMPLTTRNSLLLRSAVTTDTATTAFGELFQDDSRPIVLYDGVCNMCNSAVDVALQKDPDGRRLRFSALQSEVGQQMLVFCGRRAEDLSSMMVVKPDGECLSQSDAVVFVGQQLEGSSVLQGLSKAAQALVPKPLRDGAYNVVAKNRYRVLGRRKELRLGQDGMEDRFVNKESKPAATGV
ncbi:yuxK [Symbiodinium natans]|uniref:YuxK protein n=1 Tax=Symbiodinium natans TaxID=878477 RepID=A0A812ULJ2_9DINO|nr:yuxK [Symbiodinium natans]